MFRALAAWHSAWLSLLPAAVWAAEPAAGTVPPLAIVRYWLAIDSYRPSSAEVFGGIPLAARIRVWVALVRPCCSAADSAAATAWFSAFWPWAVETVMPAWRAISSKIWYRISHVNVACVRCDAVRLTDAGYFAAAWLRLVTSVSRVAIVIRWLPTIAAAPIFTGAHAATAKPTPTTTADALISLRSTAPSLLRDNPQRSARTDRITSPHQVSSSVSRNGRPPIAAVFGTGTSIVRTADFSIVLG